MVNLVDRKVASTACRRWTVAALKKGAVLATPRLCLDV